LGALPPVTIHLLYFYLLSDSYNKTRRFGENMDYLEWFRGQQRIAKTGDERVTERYARVVIDLTVARDEEKIHLSGDYLAVASSTGAASTTWFRLNHRNSQKIYPNEIEKLYASYKHILLTNAAEAGKQLVLYVGGALAGEIKVSSAGKTQLKNAAGTDINPATEDGNIADIEALLEFSGTPYSTPKTSTDAEVKFSATALKLKDVVIRNTHASYEVDIGLYVGGTVAAFRAASFELGGGASVGFTHVDLNQLALLSSTAGEHAIVHVIGVLE
jgi:hypothetical protein